MWWCFFSINLLIGVSCRVLCVLIQHGVVKGVSCRVLCVLIQHGVVKGVSGGVFQHQDEGPRLSSRHCMRRQRWSHP